MIASAPMFLTKADSTVTTIDEQRKLGAHAAEPRRVALDAPPP